MNPTNTTRTVDKILKVLGDYGGIKIMIKLKDILNEFISKGELKQVERKLDKIFNEIGMDVEFTHHFWERVNDKRNGKDIEPEELIDLYVRTYKKYGRKLPNWRPESEAVLHSFNTDINVPFVLHYNKKTKELEMIAKTVMRKKDFKSNTPKLNV